MRVLVVEDEQALAEAIHRGLSKEGLVVEVVRDGRDALCSATEHTYDVIVLDIMIPLVNGYRVVQELRTREVWTPIPMISAKDGDYDQTDAFELGADDYIAKPFTFPCSSRDCGRWPGVARRGDPRC